MATIRTVLNRFRALNLRAQVPIIIEQTSERIIELNQRQLYNDSEDSKGNALRLYGSFVYALEKNEKNPLPGFGRPDLYLTGGFFRDFFVVVTKSTYRIWSKNYKTADLTRKYGDIFGLTDESKTEYAKTTLYTGIQKYIIQGTGVDLR